jgi:hypothetical protein
MTRLRATLIVATLALMPLTATTALAQDDQKAPIIAEILKETHALDQVFSITQAFSQQVAPSFEELNPNQGAKIRSILENEFQAELKADQATLEKGITGVYEQNFELSELKDLLAFYQSPLGQKMVEKQPVVMQQSMQLGAAWGQAAAERALPKAIERMKSEGLNTKI